jgi:hypothetical protein
VKILLTLGNRWIKISGTKNIQNQPLPQTVTLFALQGGDGGESGKAVFSNSSPALL